MFYSITGTIAVIALVVVVLIKNYYSDTPQILVPKNVCVVAGACVLTIYASIIVSALYWLWS